MIKYIRLLLLPFSVLYGIVVIFRNKLYDWGLFKSTRFDIPVICVGNLVVGGSGKSPVTEYLVHLMAGYKIAILSRGYGRETKGFIYADQTATAKSIGDEPLQFYHKFPQVTVAVCEDRVKGITQLKDAHDVIILDDAFQHRRLNPGFSILLFEFQKLLTTQFLLPAGNMREPFWGYKRADILLVTKSPLDITVQQKKQCAAHFDKTSAAQLFFSAINYKSLTGLFTGTLLNVESLKDKKIFLLTGIANPKPLFDYLSGFSAVIEHHDYPDHHAFSLGNLRKLAEAFHQDSAKEKIIITTEKDAQRLFDVTIKELLLNLPVFYLPIHIDIEAACKKTFDQKILKYVSDTTRNR
ncbi:tetraacyldisaccharide 4'-kinase [Pedobacter cryoconitis]|uniref:tetraacyldisaccharide 4'-kinase n=1 Tax=Pedobacter cryoconitis TaxID=188932 RepID=UPI00160772DF|nr:tetraacyldisaccharide 4'-kinase [Pedobacter cryoconitis]MBB5647959.1 tetraacyldisaccharide 4'-kinase [Pedobacter cryoconitis]